MGIAERLRTRGWTLRLRSEFFLVDAVFVFATGMSELWTNLAVRSPVVRTNPVTG
jgi:hypothetical protein